jgi:3-hydroxybutyryl-CoA dehydrogenase
MNAIKLSLNRNMEKGRMTKDEMDGILHRINGTTKMSDFSDRDLVVEAIIENMEFKKKLFTELDKVCPPNTILATNTSCLSIIDMAMMTKRADKILGIHFFNPVPLMKLVEVVKTIATSPETITTGKQFGEKCGKRWLLPKIVRGLL